jgi:serine O-acetyltransferase
MNIRREAERDAQDEPLLSSFLYASILSHDSFERSLAFILSNRLSNATLLPTELFELFYVAIDSSDSIKKSAQADLCALRERDPACRSYSQAMLHFKGFHALQVQRISHALWKQKRRVMAAALQSRSSEVFAVDIHPAATIGKGVLLDHGTGVVIGETAVIGNNVSILQNVTLGGTGKQHGDRHPKVSDNVLIGASATILGNINIGKGSQVAAGSLVLRSVEPKTMVAGSPAKEVGKVQGIPALNMEQWYGSKVQKSSAPTVQEIKAQDDDDCVDVFTTSRDRDTPQTLPNQETADTQDDPVKEPEKIQSAPPRASSTTPTDSIDWII